MKDTTAAVVGGVLGAVAVSTAMYLIKAAEVIEVAKQSQESTPDHVLAQRIAAMQADLTTFATAHTTELAERTAIEHLTARLGITPEQLALAQRVGGALGQ